MTEEAVIVDVDARREGKWWVLHLADGGVTQARSLGQVDEMVTDYVGLTSGLAPNLIRVVLRSIDPGPDLAEEVARAKEARAEADRAQEIAVVAIRRAATALKSSGLAGVEVARVLGVSPQRVSQLIATSAPSPRPITARVVTTRTVTARVPRSVSARRAKS